MDALGIVCVRTGFLFFLQFFSLAISLSRSSRHCIHGYQTSSDYHYNWRAALRHHYIFYKRTSVSVCSLFDILKLVPGPPVPQFSVLFAYRL